MRRSPATIADSYLPNKQGRARLIERGLSLLDGHQETLTGVTRVAAIGQLLELRTARLDQSQAHLFTAFGAGHFDDSKMRARRGRSIDMHWSLVAIGGNATQHHWPRVKLAEDIRGVQYHWRFPE
jgi:hypothetical protein